jgi:hypothetical protein
VAIAAIQPDIADMMLVTERDGLGDRLPYAGNEAGAQKSGAADSDENRKKTDTPQNEAGNSIGVTGKNLRHPLADLHDAGMEDRRLTVFARQRFQPSRRDHQMVTKAI